MTVTVEVMNNGAFNLLSDMERLDLIRVNIPANSAFESGEKISRQFAGALKLSDAEYEAYQNVLREGRNEWNRDIY
ncbi:MAG: hypothetical protein LBQ93_10860 [Treponema sp.]|jgi:hypothetical protein|nr:hypothetical protein [Treponema sp.]